MKRKSKSCPGSGEPGAGTADPGSADQLQDIGCEVGYGKPPKHTRFVKGQSGNPRGRPRKPKPRTPRLSDALSDEFLEVEAYRSIALRENGQAIELPAVQAVLRALTTNAIKGNRLSQKYFLEHVASMEALHFQRKIDHYVRLSAVKRDGERALAEHQRKGLPPPDLLPHPDDIVLNAVTGEGYVKGPETLEDVRYLENTMQLRDHLLLRDARASDLRGKASAKPKEGGVSIYLVLAHLLDQTLPRRYRWQDDAGFSLMMEYDSLSRRERKRRIAEEFTQLEATRVRSSRITPEMRWEIDRIASNWSKRTGYSTAERNEM